MTRLRYTLRPVFPDGVKAPAQGAAPVGYQVVVMSDETIQETPLEIVQNERRLPLYPQDGRHVQDTVVSLSPRVETVLGVLPAG